MIVFFGQNKASTLLETEYININDKMQIRCKKIHPFLIIIIN